jgi:hypothetical protein
MSPLKVVEPAREILVRDGQTPEAHEGTHDLDVDLNGASSGRDAAPPMSEMGLARLSVES